MIQLVWGVLAFLASTSSPTQHTFILTDVQKPHQISVDGNDLFVFDESDYSLHVFTILPFAPRLKLGQKGDGPHDFKYLPYVYAQKEALVFTDFTKTAWFTKDGRFLKAKPYSDFKDLSLDAEILLLPVRENFVLITADHETDRRHVTLLNSDFQTIKELYEGPFTWRTDAPIHYRTDTVIQDGLIYISDTRKGIYFTVFDHNGKPLVTIDKTPDGQTAPGHPLMHQYCVSENKIYVTTYKKKNGKTEMLVLDLNGRILRKLYLPLASIRPGRGVLRYDLFTVHNGELYEIIRNGETGKWELLITELGPE